MRVITIVALGALFAAGLGAVILPAPAPSQRPGTLAGTPVNQPVAQPVTDPFAFLPTATSSAAPLTAPSQQYAAARQMLMMGRLREAQDQYLQILLSGSSIDQQAMHGLVAVEGLLANGDREVLQQQAQAYRRAVAHGGNAGEHYTPKALALLAEASLLAAREAGPEQASLPVPVGSRVPVVSGIPASTLPPPATPAPHPRPLAPSALGQIVLHIGSALNPSAPRHGVSLPRTPPPLAPARPAIPTPALNSPPSSGTSADGAGKGTRAGGSSSWGTASTERTGGSGGIENGWGHPSKVGTNTREGSGASWGSANEQGATR